MSIVDITTSLARMREAMRLYSEHIIVDRSTNAREVQKSLEDEGAVSALTEASKEWSETTLKEEAIIKLLSESFMQHTDGLRMRAENAKDIVAIAKQQVMFNCTSRHLKGYPLII